MRWFRLYNEFAFDPKVQVMNETFQRRYIMLLCLKSNGDIPGMSDDEIACALRITNEDVAETKKILIGKNLINDNWDSPAWDKRQYNSDDSSLRVKKHRENKTVNTIKKKRFGNGDVTPPDTDTDTDTDKKQSKNIKKRFAPDVLLLEDEFQKLVDGYGEQSAREMIEILDNYKGSSGKKYKSDYKAILSWVIDKWVKEHKDGRTILRDAGKPGNGSEPNSEGKVPSGFWA